MNDLENLWFYLKKNPYVFEEYKTLKKGYKKRSSEELCSSSIIKKKNKKN